MYLTLISQKKIYNLELPNDISGKYWVEDKDKPINSNKIFAVEADTNGENWVIKADEHIRISSPVLVLSKNRFFPIEFTDPELSKSFVYIEDDDSANGVYTKFRMPNNAVVSIGSADDCHIVINNKYVSSHHAQIIRQDGRWIIRESDHNNGVYVSGLRINQQHELYPGDVVYILGFKLIIGSDFFSINNPHGAISVNSQILEPIVVNEQVDNRKPKPNDNGYYYRSPRFENKVKPIEMKVDMPTSQVEQEQGTLIMSVAPQMMMGAASLTSAVFAVVNTMNNGGNIVSSIPTIVMSVCMLAGMVVFPLITKSAARKRRREKEMDRRVKYHKYLEDMKAELKRQIQQQTDVLRSSYPIVTEKLSSPEFWERHIWERTPEHSDFMSLRIGVGNYPIIGSVEFPQERFSIDDDIMKKELIEFQHEEKFLESVPIMLNVAKTKAVGIVGDEVARFNLLNNLLLQLSAFQSYDEVKVICVYEKKYEKYLGYLKWLPHSWDNEHKVRYLASTENELRELSAIVGKMVSDEAEKAEHKVHYVVIATSNYLSKKCAFISDILENPLLTNYTVVSCFDEYKALPKECKAVIEVKKDQGRYNDSVNNIQAGFVQDIVRTEAVYEYSHVLASYKLDLQRGKYDLPKMLSFMDMFGVGKIEHLNISQRWEHNDPTRTLQTPVGVDTNGDTFYLDLHERVHGPHGLVAGMTGSGKSEFIITYILSMAVNYHPNEVAFVLIDYKGGGLTGAFENEKYRLPHLAGTITNLDVSAINRSILSINSELKRRERIFGEARVIANDATMDIYKYQKLYRRGLVSEPIPHLFIISDEFAELKSQQPEFMESLISTARVGRSLGVHLILATQKPAGVVNEQIWANSRFRVCLKVQGRDDSNDMLKRPDAAEIKETGRFYLQVGYNELFELGQSAWTGAAYEDSDNVVIEKDTSIEIIDGLGNVTDVINDKKEAKEDHGKQIVRLMEYLDKKSQDEHINVRQLWLPQIEGDILLTDTISKYSFTAPEERIVAVIGEYDSPYDQKQDIFTLDFAEQGNTLVFGSAGSGDEMLLNTVLHSLYENYTPEQLNTYILDFGSEFLKVFDKAPHNGGFVIDGEHDKVASFVKLIKGEMAKRKKLFSDYGGSIVRYNALNEKKTPYIVVVINNFTHFLESYAEYEDAIQSISRECNKFGIYILASAPTQSGIRFRILQSFGNQLALKLNDASEYSAIIGRTGGMVPGKAKGSGIFSRKLVYSFQTANIVTDENMLLGYLDEFCKSLKEKYHKLRAVKIPTVPDVLRPSEASDYAEMPYKLPLGVSFANYSFKTWDLNKRNVMFALSTQSTDALNFVLGSLESIGDSMSRTIILNADVTSDKIHNVEYYNDTDSMVNVMSELYKIGLERNNNYKNSNGNPTCDMSPILVVCNRMNNIMSEAIAFNPVTGEKNEAGQKAVNGFTAVIQKVMGFCNMYFIICDDVQATSSYHLNPWFAERCLGNGIWVGNGVGNQSRFTVRERSRKLDESIRNSDGYLCEDGKVEKLRLVVTENFEVEEDE